MIQKENTYCVYITALSVIQNVQISNKKIFSEYENSCEDKSQTGEIIPGIFSGEPALRLFIKSKLQEKMIPVKYVLLSSKECYKEKKYGLQTIKEALLEAKSRVGYDEIIKTLETIGYIKGTDRFEDFTVFEYAQAIISDVIKLTENKDIDEFVISGEGDLKEDFLVVNIKM